MSTGIIDSHQHIWRLDTGLYGWLKPESGVLYRDFPADELAPLLRQNGVDATILVQAADSEAELPLLVEAAERCGFVAGIVAPLQIARPGAAQRIANARDVPRLVGYRPPISSLIDAGGQVLEDSVPALAEMSAQGMSLDCLVRGDALAALPRLAEAFPDLRLIVDHAGAPDLTGNAPSAVWMTAIAALARQPGVFCKLSGLLTLLPAGQSRQIVADHIDILLDQFGPERLLWGSDWPVLTRSAGYGDWLAYCREHLASRSEADRRAIFAGTARTAYRLPSPSL